MITVRQSAAAEVHDPDVPRLRSSTDQLRAALRNRIGELPEVFFHPLLDALRPNKIGRTFRTMPSDLQRLIGSMAGLMIVELYEDLLAEIEAEEGTK